MKVKCFKVNINTNIHKNKISNKGSQYICLSVMLIDSVYRKDKN